MQVPAVVTIDLFLFVVLFSMSFRQLRGQEWTVHLYDCRAVAAFFLRCSCSIDCVVLCIYWWRLMLGAACDRIPVDAKLLVLMARSLEVTLSVLRGSGSLYRLCHAAALALAA